MTDNQQRQPIEYQYSYDQYPTTDAGQPLVTQPQDGIPVYAAPPQPGQPMNYATSQPGYAAPQMGQPISQAPQQPMQYAPQQPMTYAPQQPMYPGQQPAQQTVVQTVGLPVVLPHPQILVVRQAGGQCCGCIAMKPGVTTIGVLFFIFFAIQVLQIVGFLANIRTYMQYIPTETIIILILQTILVISCVIACILWGKYFSKDSKASRIGIQKANRINIGIQGTTIGLRIFTLFNVGWTGAYFLWFVEDAVYLGASIYWIGVLEQWAGLIN